MRRVSQFGLIVATLSACLIQPSRAVEEGPPSERSDDQSVRERNQTSVLTGSELKRWSFTSKDERSEMRIVAEPAMRWSHFDIGRYYGDLHVVTSKERPVAVLAIFRWFHPAERAYVCITSLDDSSIVARRNGSIRWQPASSAVQWQRLANAGSPSHSQPNRLVQMRRIARRFSGEVSDKRNADPTTMKKLRLLPQPIYRYSADETDGAIFAFANGTTPAVLLCVEADLDPQKIGWRYGLARRWSFESRMSHDGQEVWTAPSAQLPTNPRDPYYIAVIPHRQPSD